PSDITITDTDSGGNNIAVTLTLNRGGRLNVPSVGGVAITNNNSSNVSLLGPVAQINQALDNMQYTPASNINGSEQLTIFANDQGAVGQGGPKTDSKTLNINLTAVNDAPSFNLPQNPNQNVVEGSGTHTVSGFASSISRGPSDESGQTLTFEVTN